jgi:glutaredoxin
MSKSVTLYTLSGCKVCKYVKEKLITIVNFQEIQCESYTNTCDYIEDKFGCELYPVVEIYEHGIIANLDIVYAVDRYDQLGSRYMVWSGSYELNNGMPCETTNVTIHSVYTKELIVQTTLKLLNS